MIDTEILDAYSDNVMFAEEKGSNGALFSYGYTKDIRGSSHNLIDKNGEVVVNYRHNDFGETTIRENVAVRNEVAYTGGMYDQDTEQYYLNARYYDPSDGRFLTQDSYRGEQKNVRTWNLYAYCNGNPINYVDPTGHTAWLIHGTWSNNKTWTDGFKTYLRGFLSEKVRVGGMGWSGGNDTGSRSRAATKISKKIIKNNKKRPKNAVRLVAHSHGGNVAIMVANKLAKKNIRVQNLITIGTPVRGYKLNKGNTVMQHINVYNDGDSVQVYGGSVWKLGKAGRTFSGAENIKIPVEKFLGIIPEKPIDNHLFMHSNVNVWKKYIAPKLKK